MVAVEKGSAGAASLREELAFDWSRCRCRLPRRDELPPFGSTWLQHPCLGTSRISSVPLEQLLAPARSRALPSAELPGCC